MDLIYLLFVLFQLFNAFNCHELNNTLIRNSVDLEMYK